MMRSKAKLTGRRRLSAGVTALLMSSALVAVAAPALSVATAAGAATAASAAGAATPFTSYEAEAGTLGGGASKVSLTSAPTDQFSSAPLEASGHAYVQLTGTGQDVKWTNNTGQPITAINVRESIPDAPSGGGITATLDLYVNGAFRQALNLNSKQTWLYEGNNNYGGNDQNPADGNPRVFFDESHTFVAGAPIAPGSTFEFRKDAANTAAFYYIDVVDVENPPPPLTQPANSISITSCGAVADNTPTNGSGDSQAVDSTGAIQSCIDQAESQGKILWIPAGTFYLKGTDGLHAQGITIAGAGMWYSTIYREVPLPNTALENGLGPIFSVTSCTVENFHLDSNATSRAMLDGAGGGMDTSGTNWMADSIWSQHVLSGFWASGTGGTVKNCRLTSIWADGINFNNVAGSVGNNLTSTNNFVRGTGDDEMAINSVAYNDSDSGRTFYNSMSDITVTHNTLIASWGGSGIGIYGGSGHVVEDNYVSDTARYLGLSIGRFGENGSDLLSATVSGNVVVRSGGNGYNDGQPAISLGDGNHLGTVTNVSLTGNTVINSLYDAIGIAESAGSIVQNNTIISPWRNGIVIAPTFQAPTGSATITGNSVTGLPSGGAPFINNSSGFTATLNNNNWQIPGEVPAAVPGIVEAENYDQGGQGKAYNASVNGTANGYRSDGVDLETTPDSGGGYDLGWTGSGQWFRYTVSAASAGTYTVAFRVSSPGGVTDAFHLSDASGNNLSGAVNIPATGGWQTWTTVTASVTLSAGQQVLTLNQDAGGWNINNMSFAARYKVVNQNSGSCVDDTGQSTANGTSVEQWSCNGGANQIWQFTPTSSGYYEVLNLNAAAQNEVWDVTGGPSATDSGIKIQTWSYGGGTNQQWQPMPVGNGYDKFVARNSGLCLDVPAASTADGVQLQQYPCNGTGAQAFRMVQV